MTVTIDPLPDDTGLLIEDRIEQRQCRVLTATDVVIQEIDRSQFLYPIDKAVTVEAREVTISNRPTAYLRDIHGELIENIEHFTTRSLPNNKYILEVPGPVKLYFQIEGPLVISVDGNQITLSFDGSSTIVIGARSYHEHPAATVTTTTDPEDLMSAISYFSSSLKTITPERSYPNLRGHPPDLVVGDELDIPDRLNRPETGLRIEIRPDIIPALVVAPLAYYLGANVVPGSTGRITTKSGFEYPLEEGLKFESTIERILKQVFFLDCLVRTEGAYGMPLRERHLVEPKLGLDLEASYDASPTERLKKYLSIPFDRIEDFIPQWKLTAHVGPTQESIEMLSFLVDDLAVIRTPSDIAVANNSQEIAAIEDFARGNIRSSQHPRNNGQEKNIPSIVEPEETDSLEQAWVGDDVPIGASKAMVEAFRNRLSRGEKEGPIDIVVVCNDAEMLDEHDTANEVYGSRDELPFDVTSYDDLTTDRLKLILESEIDYFHYIGHIDDGGFECTDGMLDVKTLDEVGVDVFFLNACESYHQGVELIRRGGIGGVVTLDEVINSGAVRVGKTMTRLLNRGFPLRAALNIARDRSIVGSQYIVVGDGNADIAHGASLVPNLVEITHSNEKRFNVTQQTYYSAHLGLGAVVKPEILQGDEHFLVGSPLNNSEVSRQELREFLNLEIVPVRINQQFRWSDAIDLKGV